MSSKSHSHALEWLKKGNVRPTKQRIALAELLVGDGEHYHICADRLHATALENGVIVSLATVYNTLHIFSDAKLLNEIFVHGHKSYFDTRLDEHPHYYWEETGKLTDAPKKTVTLKYMSEPPEGMRISGMDVVIRLQRE